MKDQSVEKVSIIGAGLVGTLMGIYLAKQGYQVYLCEKRADIRIIGEEKGRSINLALSNRGWKALKEIGLEEAAKKLVIPMKARVMHSIDGQLTYQPYGKEGEYINSISRGKLNELLLDEAERLGVKLNFEWKCLGIDYNNSIITVEDAGGPKVIKTDLVIGADGAFSLVRGGMQRSYRFNYSQHFLAHGYKELKIPPKEDGGFFIDKNALHIWPREKFMFIALPNLDGSFTCTLFLPFEGGPQSFDALQTDQAVMDFFKTTFPDIIPFMPTLQKDFWQNPTSSLVTISCYPWCRNRTVLIGDASHAIVPFYGQGMNSGFEDCSVFNELIDRYDHDWDAILDEFQRVRKPEAEAISSLALQNFIEMRDLVADESFLLRKKIEARLHQLYPSRWIPLYSMVTFREDIKYSEALKRGTHQKSIMDKVMKTPNIQEIWENLDFGAIVDQLDVLD